MASKRANTVKHTVVVGRKYKVYSFENGVTNFLAEVETDGTRPREVALCKEYDVKKVILEESEKVTKTYELDLQTFMELANEVTEED